MSTLSTMNKISRTIIHYYCLVSAPAWHTPASLHRDNKLSEDVLTLGCPDLEAEDTIVLYFEWSFEIREFLEDNYATFWNLVFRDGPGGPGGWRWGVRRWGPLTRRWRGGRPGSWAPVILLITSLQWFDKLYKDKRKFIIERRKRLELHIYF